MHDIVYCQLRYLSPVATTTDKVRPWPWVEGGRGSGAVGVPPKVLTLKTAIYLLSVIQTLLQIIADERNPFGGLPRRDKNGCFSQWHNWTKDFYNGASARYAPCAVKNKRLSRYDVILNECLFACFLTTSAEVSKREVHKPITNC